MKLGRLVNHVLALFGLRLSWVSIQIHKQPLSFDAICERLNQRGLEINTVFDIGTSNGSWSQKIQPVYPQAFNFLIEANTYHAEGLKAFKRNNIQSDYVLAVAGNETGEVFFDQSDPFVGVASHVKSEKFCHSLPCVTVDDEVIKRKLKEPYLLKLDTHGFEVPIIEGAEKTLRHTNLIFVETYNFDIKKSSLRFWELCQFLFEKGFRPIDSCDPMHHPRDGSFWQIDILFF